MPVPLPNNSLRYVFVYVFESAKGVYLVDAGWNTDDAYQALEAGLATAGYGMGDVQGVMVTHIHPDHYGLAGRIREASGAWISLHPADARHIQDRYVEPTDLLERMGAMLRRNGAPAEEIATLQNVAMPVRSFVDPVLPDVMLEDGERPEVPGWDLSAIWTPGHTPGHLCFWEPRHRLLLTGDLTVPWAGVDASDYRVRAGALVPIVGSRRWKLAGSLAPTLRGTRNDTGRMTSAGAVTAFLDRGGPG